MMTQTKSKLNKRATHASTGMSTRERILGAARDLFFFKGFASVSTDQLAKTASVSKTSIYKQFGDMAGVLQAVVLAEGDRFFDGVLPEPTTREDFIVGLEVYGANLLRLLNQPDVIQFDRLMHEQARAHPETAKRFYDTAYGRSHNDIAQMISYAQRRGWVLQGAEADVLADNLISMWDGLRFSRARLGLVARPFEDPEGWSRHCVGILFAES